MKVIDDFDLFINPNNRSLEEYNFIDHNCLNYCTYVRYIIIPTINGEIFGEPIIIDDKEKLKEYLYSDNLILSINYLDNIVKEVRL